MGHRLRPGNVWSMSDRPSADDRQLIEGVIAGDRTSIGRAITLVESTRADHRERAAAVLSELIEQRGSAHRVGVTGVPGVGKSTFIETLGLHLIGSGKSVAVLAVDPSSSRSGGSILGDKTRMAGLAVSDRAFIRPSPSSGTLGGVARATRESMIVLEAAGYDVILVETVGVGQSEITVHGMVDHFLVLMLAGAGDELQGIKKGVLELADMVAVNKADGDNTEPADLAAVEYRRALHLLTPASASWSVPVVTCSARTGAGISELWDNVDEHRRQMASSGEFDARRRRQQVEWMESMLAERVLRRFMSDPAVELHMEQLKAEVLAGRLAASTAVDRVLDGPEPA